MRTSRQPTKYTTQRNPRCQRMKKPSTLRWTIQQAASEFGPAERTVKNRLNLLGFVPGEDGMFSTRQIHAAICDHDRNLQRKAAAEADRVELENAAVRRDLVSVHELAPIINRAITSIKAEIDSLSYVEREDKDRLMTKCGDLWAEAFNPQPSEEANAS